MKECKVCNQVKELSEFVKHKECKDGHTNCCKKCKLELQKISRQKNNNKYTKIYEKTVTGFLMRTYRNMQSRINGIQYKKHHLYAGKSILSKDDFYNWALLNNEFKNLFEVWEKNNYQNRLTPSVDRLDEKLGYSIDNMQWITHSENSRKGALSRFKKV